MKLILPFTIICTSLFTAYATTNAQNGALDRIEIERVRRLANALNVSDMGTQDMLKVAGDAKREFPHLLRLVDDVLENSMVKKIVDPVVDRVLPTVSNIINPEHVYRIADNAVNAGFEVADGLLRAVFGSESGLGDILYRPRPKKPAMAVPPFSSYPVYIKMQTL
ncbi:hypothetical protein GGI25_000396 [Coemansia spiralis]|uniref:Uncharacterized protein n=2 Tax=Coemansia TaxID=4863 RepID=A0A9W8GC95_9FUNG|nr:hypothetical protein BX070DRAFT_221461 [Coemansia spiralis]KAJ1996333.1 hypothetical protein EDC05_000223 [Coemansia umbellata]KAJ2624202.1 hypothetical protein GGI26_001778 [Coemansia sp. RSA 1358]KAJ2680761.1 hypothetical protein GGI25_000396 [Coemansia spiralis]